MYHHLPECSQCGSKVSETFRRTDRSGRRCLNCGHEQITEDRTGPKVKQTYWNNHSRPIF
jgi:predicted RNA-binding Zn-ribbon protein involved in translation (DUF1610 family)